MMSMIKSIFIDYNGEPFSAFAHIVEEDCTPLTRAVLLYLNLVALLFS